MRNNGLGRRVSHDNVRVRIAVRRVLDRYSRQSRDARGGVLVWSVDEDGTASAAISAAGPAAVCVCGARHGLG